MKLCKHVDCATSCPFDKPVCLPEVSCPLAVAAVASDKTLVLVDELALLIQRLTQRIEVLEAAVSKKNRLKTPRRGQVIPLRVE